MEEKEEQWEGSKEGRKDRIVRGGKGGREVRKPFSALWRLYSLEPL